MTCLRRSVAGCPRAERLPRALAGRSHGLAVSAWLTSWIVEQDGAVADHAGQVYGVQAGCLLRRGREAQDLAGVVRLFVDPAGRRLGT